ncbi:uncharacterized protein PFL1_04490 [Pseudozyma flocculosa PF-1]|uniref:Mitochondrial genome maintenance protein MGM101 n=2 Tax=Pseudozyma flocculosa TaxID=84751 RepID=A0A5C3FE46_9BASI|nr:uncharacterized protein PFL1_04490 [Pseudozyma flocculosa PF-1]EPQ28163.1 hypothetical protein PFL1_04490 [Pseudozyma flocculosa PF-1]SPO41965.1 probable MGM101 - mitochondrial genome maintenance protein [Pseudozyma flocculosa]
MNALPSLARLAPRHATRIATRSFSQCTLPVYSSRPKQAGGTYQRPAPATARTSVDDLHPLPDSIKQSITADPEPTEPYTATGNSNAPEDHSSRPAQLGPSAPDVDPSVAAPGQVGRASGSSPASSSEAWGTSFAGLGEKSFSKDAVDVLNAPINEQDVEIKPDGLIYLPEIKYRRILNKAFGPGGWGMAPRSETNVGQGIVSREWVLICNGRFVATARGEQEFFKPSGVPTASEGAKSNALMRCCKDLGVASELWDPRFIRQFRKKHCVEVWCSDTSGKKKKLWRRKDDPAFEYPWKENGFA